ncbi:MAG: SDR family NAD(P)-dependent oxidoreductase [Ruminococcaceae bacterium]|nr:SDR family NAD(P)-dependent oxidoreductase [Oscillospiraceae bacterium]
MRLNDYTTIPITCQALFLLKILTFYVTILKKFKRVNFMITAIITGASSGLGREFALALKKRCPDIESFWLIARRREKLEELAKELGEDKCFVLPLDLTGEEYVSELTQVLSDSVPEIKYLINNAGYGKLDYFENIPVGDCANQVTLNCVSLTTVTRLCLPYMEKDGEIINVASIASFAPNARMTVYSSTKAYVLSFSRSLREEFKMSGKKLNCLAVCPGPMDTEFLPVANIGKGTSKTFDTLPRTNPKKVAEKALKMSAKKKAVYTPKFFFKFYRVLSKILPTSLVMKLAKT